MLEEEQAGKFSRIETNPAARKENDDLVVPTESCILTAVNRNSSSGECGIPGGAETENCVPGVYGIHWSALRIFEGFSAGTNDTGIL